MKHHRFINDASNGYQTGASHAVNSVISLESETLYGPHNLHPPPHNHNQDRQHIPHGIHNQIEHVEAVAGREQLVASAEQRARKADGKRTNVIG